MSGTTEEPPRARSSGGRRAAAVVLPIVAGLVIAAGAIAAVLIVMQGDDNGEAATPADAPAAPATIDSGPVLRIVFPEGFTRQEMAERIGAVNEIAANERGVDTALVPREYRVITRSSPLPGEFAGDDRARSLEGFLFPATYTFTPETTTQQLVDQQLAAFEDAWSQVNLETAEEKNLTPYDVLIIASMIEEEVRLPRERKLVAAVIYNRLRAGMTLGIDSTLRYGLDIPPTAAITDSDLASDNPYNTRKHLGLPPTPISNPGLAAMQAAANPAETDFLFFVRKKDCRSHFFASTETEFLSFLEGPNSFRNGPNECA
jgi:UPF0755 protein